MRRFLLAAVMFGAASGAQAADMPDFPLRGTLPDGRRADQVNWQGWYVGGQAGYGSSDDEFQRLDRQHDRRPDFRQRHRRQMRRRAMESSARQGQSARAPASAASSATTGSGTTSSSASKRTILARHVSAVRPARTKGRSVAEPACFADDFFHGVTADVDRLRSAISGRWRRSAAAPARPTADFLPYMFGGLALGTCRHLAHGIELRAPDDRHAARSLDQLPAAAIRADLDRCASTIT